MNPVKNILNFLKIYPNIKMEKTPGGFCPNCWGRQEYGNQFYKPVKSSSKRDQKQKKGWIASYVEHNFTGIYPKRKDEKQVCNVCFEACEY